jgi:hypothetical protein
MHMNGVYWDHVRGSGEEGDSGNSVKQQTAAAPSYLPMPCTHANPVRRLSSQPSLTDPQN